ncbi:MAG TPA: methylated-DNA--[protein]-cysteine S-methyltransferase, partial [Dehalococcoidia bacterium]|nr:methylated-DNA--[protein]-cysteine S-methyltransferase [Dehalococcoidia bacterium]
WPERALEAAGGAHREAHSQLRAYFAGRLRRFELDLDLDEPTLIARGWHAAVEIPYGCTLTYGELALDAGAPGRARAMGRAMSLCPLPLFVPCHRVVGAGGGPRGERESWQRRQALLAFERACLAGT